MNYPDVDKDIHECLAMIDHFIQLKELGVTYAAKELAYWRRMLQRAKICKRRLAEA